MAEYGKKHASETRYTPSLRAVCGCETWDEGARLVINLCTPHRMEGNAARLATEALGTVPT